MYIDSTFRYQRCNNVTEFPKTIIKTHGFLKLTDLNLTKEISDKNQKHKNISCKQEYSIIWNQQKYFMFVNNTQ